MPVHGSSAASEVTLIAVAHGTEDQAGIEVLETLAAAVRAELAGVPVALCYVDVASPTLAQTLAAVAGPAVLVPLLLSTGYHVKVDIPGLVAGRAEVVVTDPVGPDERVSAAAVRRLQEALSVAGGEPGELIVVSAGSSDPEARAQLTIVAGHIERLTGLPVRIAQLTEADPFMDVPASVGVVNYLLAPGYFAGKLVALAAPRVTGQPIGADPLLVEVIVERYRAGAARLKEVQRTL